MTPILAELLSEEASWRTHGGRAKSHESAAWMKSAILATTTPHALFSSFDATLDARPSAASAVLWSHADLSGSSLGGMRDASLRHSAVGCRGQSFQGYLTHSGRYTPMMSPETEEQSTFKILSISPVFIL